MNSSQSKSANILVVDDTATVAQLMQEMLLAFGYQVSVCLNPIEALEQFEPGKFDLVITDYTMPGMTGVEFSKAVKTKSTGQRVLLITGSAFSMSADESRSLPVDGVLQKPFSTEEFEKAVAVALPRTNPTPSISHRTGERPRL